MDVLSLSEPLKTTIKKEQEEKQEEMRFYLPPTPGSGFVGDITQKVGRYCSGAVKSWARCRVQTPHQMSPNTSLPIT